MRKKCTVGIMIVVALVVVLWVWPSPEYNLAGVHPSLRELATPYQSVYTGCFLDGGSLSVRIVDKNGRVAEFALPVDSQCSYPRLFIGVRHVSDTNAVEVAFTQDTRRALISIIDTHRNSSDNSDYALVYLRGALRDHARFWGHAVVKLCKGVQQ